MNEISQVFQRSKSKDMLEMFITPEYSPAF